VSALRLAYALVFGTVLACPWPSCPGKARALPSPASVDTTNQGDITSSRADIGDSPRLAITVEAKRTEQLSPASSTRFASLLSC
jgi:hypothetical protein